MTTPAAGQGTVTTAAGLAAGPAGTQAALRTVMDCQSEEPGLVRRLVEVPPGASFGRRAGPAGELWFVIEGAGTLELPGHPAIALTPDRGVWIPPGSAYQALGGKDGQLRADLVELPASGQDGARGPDAPLARDLSDCAVETTGDRRFRVLFGPGLDCPVATQFVGEIPPGRASEHSHPYDEVVLILRGEGIVHMGGIGRPLSPGSCVHLPPGLPHCLENTGAVAMRVLGVFHPADSPAAKLGS